MKRITKLTSLSSMLLLAACGGDSPTSPDNFQPPEGTYRSVFAPVSGQGVGGVSVTPVANGSHFLDVIIKVRVEGASPNTTYLVQRAPEGARANGADGICQRAFGLSPWSTSDPPAPAFVTFPVPASGPRVSFTTQANGNGSIDFEFALPTFPTPATFDVMFRVVDAENAPSTELRSGCFTVTAQ